MKLSIFAAIIFSTFTAAQAQVPRTGDDLRENTELILPTEFAGSAAIHIAKAPQSTQKLLLKARAKMYVIANIYSVAVARKNEKPQFMTFKKIDNKMYLLKGQLTEEAITYFSNEIYELGLIKESSDTQVGECSKNICRMVIMNDQSNGRDDLISRVTFVFEPQQVTLYLSGIALGRGISSDDMYSYGDVKSVMRMVR